MSKFFRKNPDSDSSSSASDSEELEEDEELDQDANAPSASESRSLDQATSPAQEEPSNAVAVAGPNKDLLLHALLEAYTLNQIREEHAGRTTSEATILREARHRFVDFYPRTRLAYSEPNRLF